MRLLNTRAHGAVDYLLGILLVASPWLFGFTHEALATWLPIAGGVGVLGMSFLTDYEWGALPRVPAPVHLGLDVGIGTLLAVSPWAVGFYRAVWAPHLFLGLATIGLALATHPVPGRGRLEQTPEAMMRR